MTQRLRTTVLTSRSLLLAVCGWLLGMLWLGMLPLTPPAAQPATAPAEEFASGRAIQLLETIAREPHPTGTPAQKAVEDFLVRQLTELGLAPQVQSTTGLRTMYGAPYEAATINNVLARLGGTAPTKAIVLMAHYDSVPMGPGASDDGAAVAALLETLRALKASSPLRNDLIVLFTDGEEAGLLGASAFVAEHPWARDVGLVINFEARGHTGPSIMFETTSDNGWITGEVIRSAPHLLANSLTYEVYKLLPNDTDLTVFRMAGYSGINFSYIGGLNRYHSALDTIAALDERSLQHHGGYALALARHFGQLDLSAPRQADNVYFNFLGSALIVHYPVSWVLPLSLLISLLLLGTLGAGLRRKVLTVRGGLAGFGIGLLLLVGSGALTTAIWMVIGALHRGYSATATGDLYNRSWYLGGFILLVSAFAMLLYRWAFGLFQTVDLVAGSLLAWLILLALTTSLLPGASYLFAWPLLASTLGMAAVVFRGSMFSAGVRRDALLAVCGGIGVLLLAPIAALIYVALTIEVVAAPMVLVALIITLILPLLSLVSRSRLKWIASAAAAMALMLIVAGSATAGFDTTHPQTTSLWYGLDADTNMAVWATDAAATDRWTAQFFTSTPAPDALPAYFPYGRRAFLTAPAPALPLPPPTVAVVEDRRQNGIRTLQLLISSPRGATRLVVGLQSETTILASSVNGKQIVDPADDSNHGLWSLIYTGIPAEGIELILEFPEAQPLQLRVVDQTYALPGLSELGYAPRPQDMIGAPSGFSISDMTLVTRSFMP